MGTIYLGEIGAHGKPLPLRIRECDRWAAHQGRVYDLRFSNDGKKLYSVGSEGVVRVWNIDPPPVKQTEVEVLTGVDCELIATSWNNEAALIAYNTKALLWNRRDAEPKLLVETDRPIMQLCFV